MQEGWTRKIQTGQENIATLWQELIYKALIVQEGFDESFCPQIMWGEPETLKPEDSRKLILQVLNPQQAQVTPRTRLDFENMLRAEFDLETIDIDQELLSQSAMQAVQQDKTAQLQKAQQETEKEKVGLLKEMRRELAGK